MTSGITVSNATTSAVQNITLAKDNTAPSSPTEIASTSVYRPTAPNEGNMIRNDNCDGKLEEEMGKKPDNLNEKAKPVNTMPETSTALDLTMKDMNRA